jgi:hypothetical protein
MKTCIAIAILVSCCLLSFATFAKGDNHDLERELWDELFNPPYKRVTELRKGDTLRAELFNRLRPTVSKAAKETVKFSGRLQVYKNWAFFTGETYSPDGKLIVYPPMGNSDTAALLLHTHNGWTVVDYSVGHSDVVWELWPSQYGAPTPLFKLQ